jgi:hypothetical protein
MPEKSEATLGMEFCRRLAESPRAAMSKYRFAVLTSAVRVGSSMSLAVKQVWAWAKPALMITVITQRLADRRRFVVDVFIVLYSTTADWTMRVLREF